MITLRVLVLSCKETQNWGIANVDQVYFFFASFSIGVKGERETPGQSSTVLARLGNPPTP
jgi:hypothetical protein